MSDDHRFCLLSKYFIATFMPYLRIIQVRLRRKLLVGAVSKNGG